MIQDCSRSITTFLTLKDLPSLRACRNFHGLRVTLIEQQAVFFGYPKSETGHLEYLKKLFSAVRSINRKATMCVTLKGFFTSSYYEILYRFRTLSLNEFLDANSTAWASDQLLRPLLLHVISLSELKMAGPIDQAIKEKALGNAIDYGPDAEITCKKIIASGADLNHIYKAYGETVLHRAVRKNNVPLAKFLFSQKANPHIVTHITKQSTLQIAVEIGSIPMLEFLLSIGVIDIPTETGTAFSDAMKNCLWNPQDPKIDLAKLLKIQAQRAPYLNTYLFTYLHLAVLYDQQTWMLEDYDPTPLLESKDSTGATPLHHAVLNRKGTMIQYLLKWGADPEARDNRGNTPPDYAIPDLIPLFTRGIKRHSQI